MNPKTEKIYNTAFDLIELRLYKKEQVSPFSIHLLATEDNPIITMFEDHSQDTKEMIENMRTQLKLLVHHKNAVCVCLAYDVFVTDPRTNKKTDAVLIEIADTEGYSVNIYLPYNFNDEEIIKKPFQIPSDQKYYSL